LFLSFPEEVQVALVRGTSAVPKEKPLHELAMLERIFKAEMMVDIQL
jgi:hypothetical protein